MGVETSSDIAAFPHVSEHKKVYETMPQVLW